MKKIAKTYPNYEGFHIYYLIPEVETLPKQFKRLNESDQAIIEYWVRFLVFTTCLGNNIAEACPLEPPVYNG